MSKNWKNIQQKRSNLLGVSISKAQHKLRASIFFDLVIRTNNDVCFRCNEKIVSADDLSIDHKEAWERADDPVMAFFDLENISFSHRSCNYSAAFRQKTYTTKAARDRAKRARKRARKEQAATSLQTCLNNILSDISGA